MIKEKVAVLGASPNPERYANMTLKLLQEEGYLVFPVNPHYQMIEGLTCFSGISHIPDIIDTITVYVNPDHLEEVCHSIISKKPNRIIFNPGSESDLAKKVFENAGIEVLEACTLVLLKTGQFDQ